MATRGKNRGFKIYSEIAESLAVELSEERENLRLFYSGRVDIDVWVKRIVFRAALVGVFHQQDALKQYVLLFS